MDIDLTNVVNVDRQILSKIYSYTIFALCVIILLTSSIATGLSIENNDIKDDRGIIDPKKQIATWNDNYVDLESEENNLHTDEFTRGILILSSISDNNYEVNRAHSTYPVLLTSDALKLAEFNNNDLSHRYYILDFKRNSISLQNWYTIQSWSNWSTSINTNKDVNLIYDNDYNSIYISKSVSV